MLNVMVCCLPMEFSACSALVVPVLQLPVGSLVNLAIWPSTVNIILPPHCLGSFVLTDRIIIATGGYGVCARVYMREQMCVSIFITIQ